MCARWCAGVAEHLRGRAGVEQRKRRLLRSFGLRNMPSHWQDCGRYRVDHINPLAFGGDDSDDDTRNLSDLCHDNVTAEQVEHRKRVEIRFDGWPT